MTMFKKAMSYLGLGPEDPYDDYDLPEEPERPVRSRAYAPDVEQAPVRQMQRPAAASVREPMTASFPRAADMDAPTSTVRVQRPAATSSTVRTVPASGSRPHTVRPRRFDQAQEVADRFKEGQPVIVNLQDVERELERRLIDFCSGLCYGLDGKMEKVANGVYLLTPANTSVSPEDRRLIGEMDD